VAIRVISGLNYLYDAFNRRIERKADENGAGTGGESAEHYFYDGDNVVLDAVDEDGVGTVDHPRPARRYLWGEAVDQLLAQENLPETGDPTPDDLFWTLQDRQQSVGDAINASGTVYLHNDYDAFGKGYLTETDYSGGSIDAANLPRYQYTCQELDPLTELYHFNARPYDPDTGRFLVEDFAGLGVDENLYRYVGNNPINLTDPTGLCGYGGSGYNALGGYYYGLTPIQDYTFQSAPTVNWSGITGINYSASQWTFTNPIPSVSAATAAPTYNPNPAPVISGGPFTPWDITTDPSSSYYDNPLYLTGGANITSQGISDLYTPSYNVTTPVSSSNSSTNASTQIVDFGTIKNTNIGDVGYVVNSSGKTTYVENTLGKEVFPSGNGNFTIPGIASGLIVAAPYAAPAIAASGTVGATAVATVSSPYVIGGTTAAGAYITGNYGYATYQSYQAGDIRSGTENLFNTIGYGAGTVLDAYGTVRSATAKVATTGGRLGSASTRAQVADIAEELESRGWKIEYGGGQFKEYIPGPGGSRKGSAYPDITATKNGRTLRINTVDTLSDGLTPTAREAANAAKIRSLKPDEHLLLIPKRK
jgi:RHS repeat-associated protein